MPSHVEVDAVTADELAGLTALDGMRAKLDAMLESEIERRITLDVAQAALTAGATVAKVEAFRGELIKVFGPAAGDVIEAVRVEALATRQADNELAIGASPRDLTALFERVRSKHAWFIADAESLAARGFIDGKRLEPARNLQGFHQTAQSVERLVAVLREEWPNIEGHTPLTKTDLDTADVEAKRFAAAVAARDNGVNRAPAIETRIRIVTCLMRSYDELRRMMSYLRWHQDDVDMFAPSLWASRGRRARTQNGTNDDLDVDTDDDGPSPATPSPNNGGAPFTE